jgi:hypothetical protein
MAERKRIEEEFPTAELASPTFRRQQPDRAELVKGHNPELWTDC